VEVPPRIKTINATKRAMVTIFLTGRKFLILDPLSREEKFNQDYFMAVDAPELSKENMNAERKVRKNRLFVHINNSMCHNGRKIRVYLPRKTLTRVPDPVDLPDLSPSDFWTFGYAKEQTKNQISRSENDLEDKLTEVGRPFGESSFNQCSTSGCQDWNG
jgi:hypothetical protein